MAAATDFFGEPVRPSVPLRWYLLECGHYGQGRLRGRETSINCEVCECPRRAVTQVKGSR